MLVGDPTPNYDIVNCGSIEQGYKQLCTRCFNLQMAKLDGLDSFEHADFEPIGLSGPTGKIHEFHFRARLFGTGVALDAFELHEGNPEGYKFRVIGEPESDLLVLLGQLIANIRSTLCIKHIEDATSGLRIADHNTVRGVIEWDDTQEGQVPLLVIDGRSITWEEFGRMLMSFEGWQFKLAIHDMSEEV